MKILASCPCKNLHCNQELGPGPDAVSTVPHRARQASTDHDKARKLAAPRATMKTRNGGRRIVPGLQAFRQQTQRPSGLPYDRLHHAIEVGKDENSRFDALRSRRACVPMRVKASVPLGAGLRSEREASVGRCSWSGFCAGFA